MIKIGETLQHIIFFMYVAFSVQSRTNPTGCLFDINDGSCNHSLTKTTSHFTQSSNSQIPRCICNFTLERADWSHSYSTTCILPRLLIFCSFQQNALLNVDSLNIAVAGRSRFTATVRGSLFSCAFTA